MTVHQAPKLLKTSLKRDKTSFESTTLQSLEQSKTVIRKLSQNYGIGNLIRNAKEFQGK
jgi:hypothetical protein